jgi:hypothetical protein
MAACQHPKKKIPRFQVKLMDNPLTCVVLSDKKEASFRRDGRVVEGGGLENR